MEPRPLNPLLIPAAAFAVIALTTIACGFGTSLSTPLPAGQPLEAQTLPPSVIPRQPRTPTPAPLILPSPTATATAFPAWVTDFSDPILASIDDEYPVFADEFPAICVDERKKWKVCATPERRTYYQSNESNESPISDLALATARPTLDLQPDLKNGYTLLNKGWFYVVPDSPVNPFYARIDSGTLVLSLPTGKTNRDFWVYTPYFLRKNFALQFDLEFYETQPEDTFRFQFEQGGLERFALDLAKNRTWTFHWGVGDAAQSRSGVYEGLSFGTTRALVITRGTRCAIYLNNTPLDYFENCRGNPDIKPSVQSATFHILAEPGHSSVVTIDNVGLWDLDQVPSPP
jgi:hypothetical protein